MPRRGWPSRPPDGPAALHHRGLGEKSKHQGVCNFPSANYSLHFLCHLPSAITAFRITFSHYASPSPLGFSPVAEFPRLAQPVPRRGYRYDGSGSNSY